MKPKTVLALLVCISVLLSVNTYAQTGYIYTHLNHISEDNSAAATTPPDYSFVLKKSSGTVASSFSLNDQATADNNANTASKRNKLLQAKTGGCKRVVSPAPCKIIWLLN